MRTTPKANNHPTVKPISLMRYLVRLVKTPFDTCTIADFFMGSGTTGVACMLEGINFVGCDGDENSFTISQARIEYAKNDYLKEQAKPKQSSLFTDNQELKHTQLKLL
jgi:site-specific DNA-methyltransferase (adenine-specific)